MLGGVGRAVRDGGTCMINLEPTQTCVDLREYLLRPVARRNLAVLWHDHLGKIFPSDHWFELSVHLTRFLPKLSSKRLYSFRV